MNSKTLEYRGTIFHYVGENIGGEDVYKTEDGSKFLIKTKKTIQAHLKNMRYVPVGSEDFLYVSNN